MKRSAGILLYRHDGGVLLVLLGHPGGPFWRGRDDGAWTIPKGECVEGEDIDAAARREFREETGRAAEGRLQPLGEIRQNSGKRVSAFALEGAFDVSNLDSNSFEMEWPPRSGRMQSFPEIDRAEWFTLGDARRKIIAGQSPFLDQLETLLGGGTAGPA